MSWASRWLAILFSAAVLLAGCGSQADRTPLSTPEETLAVPGEGTAGPGTFPGPAVAAFPDAAEPERYRRLGAPLAARSQDDQSELLPDNAGFRSGDYRMEFSGGRFLIYPEGGEIALVLTLPGGEGLNAFPSASQIESQETGFGEQMVLSGITSWGAAFRATIYTYSFQPGLFRWRFELVPTGSPPSGPEPELEFVDRDSGEQAEGRLRVYAEPAPMAAPQLYAYSPALDSTFFYWVDRTALNPFMQAAHFPLLRLHGARGNASGTASRKATYEVKWRRSQWLFTIAIFISIQASPRMKRRCSGATWQAWAIFTT